MRETELAGWIGRSRTETDLVTLAPCRGMAALLDRDPDAFASGKPLPPAWHWLYFKPAARQSQLGPDGHEKKGEFLPDLPYPRRMWAGGRLRFVGELTLGDEVERQSTIVAIEEKEGRTGPLLFVTVKHALSTARGLAVEEEQNLVYRGHRRPEEGIPVGSPPPEGGTWRETFLATSVALFRFSALTFNGHRIHYDHPYATGVEGYPGLVVHAPLTALLLLDAAARNRGARPAGYTYRAVAPLFGDEQIILAGDGTTGGVSEAWAASPERGTAMKASIEWAGT